MTSSLRQRLASLTTRSLGDDALQQETAKYKLMVTAGPSYDQSKHQIVHVNSDQCTIVENDLIKAKINVRIRSFHGLPASSPSHSPYFDDAMHEKDQYSVAFSFVPKQDLPSVDTVWGNDFDHPIRERLPPGFNTAFRIVKEFIDPGLNCDAYADEPWLYGPSLSCWFAFRIGDQVDLDKGEDFPAPSESVIMTEGADGSGQEVRHNAKLPENNQTRRKFFLSEQNREQFTFEKGRLYQGDFYNPYIDFGNFALKLPGFSLKVIKYVDQKSHCLRYVFKNRDSKDVFFNINFHLLWGQQLEDALEEDGKRDAAQNGHVDNNPGSLDGPSCDKNDLGAEQANAEVAAVDSTYTRSAEVPGPLDVTQNHVRDMQLHPGEQNAATEVSFAQSQMNGPNSLGAPNTNSSNVDRSQVDEIANILQQTASDDRTGKSMDIMQN